MTESVPKLDSTDFDAFTGFWINWTHGHVQGATLTVNKRMGGFLIAFFALYVSATGHSLWTLCCFVLHRYFSSSKPQDGLYHQRQVILRNSESAHTGAFAVFWTAYSWRKVAERPWRRLTPLLIFSLALGGAFVVAGVYSSQVTTQNEANEVLLRGARCGVVPTYVSKDVDQTAWNTYVQDYVSAYLDYARQCYSNSFASFLKNCRKFVKPSLPYTVDSNSTCPFAPEICKNQSGNLILDTGMLDSHHDMGLNAPKKDRFQMRNRVECAPLATKGYSERFQNEANPALSTKRYFYGNANVDGRYIRGNSSFTFQVPTDFFSARLQNYTFIQGPNPDYHIGLMSTNSMEEGWDLFTPIPQLLQDHKGGQPDRDLWLFYLSAPGVVYQYKVDDPWFAAHTPTNFSNMFNGPLREKLLFVRDKPAGVIACTSQVQYCYPNMPDEVRCEPLTSYGTSYYNSTMAKFPPTDQFSMPWAKNITIRSTSIQMGLPYQILGAGALTVRPRMYRGMHFDRIPQTQWQHEMEYLFQASLASYQVVFTETANGPPTEAIAKHAQRPLDKASSSMCQNQKIISSRYHSFSVLGMVIILATGTTIIFLDYTVESIFTWMDKKWLAPNDSRTYARLEWATNSTLQLQRLAHEELGLGTWRSCADLNPITEADEKLGLVDISDEKHPVLVRPDPEIESSSSSTLDIHSIVNSSKCSETGIPQILTRRRAISL